MVFSCCVIESRSRDGGLSHNETSRLCRVGCPYRYFQPPQGNQEEFFAGHQRSVSLWYLHPVFHLSILVTLFPVNPKNGRPAGMISKETYDVVMTHADTLNSAIIYTRDFNYN